MFVASEMGNLNATLRDLLLYEPSVIVTVGHIH